LQYTKFGEIINRLYKNSRNLVIKSDAI